MKRGIISKVLTSGMVLLLAGGCNTVYEWWDFSSEPKPQEPVVSANPPAAEPPPFTNPDSSPAADHPDLVVPAESVVAPQVAAVPSSDPKPLSSEPVPVLVNPEVKEAEDILVRAKERLDWATGIGAKTQFPAPYTKATTAYNTAVKATILQNWQNTVSESKATIAAVAEIESLLAALQAKEAEDALARAKERLDWATGIGAKTQFPAPYTKATTAYNTAIKAKTAQNWQDTVSGSQATIAAVAEIESLLAALQVKDAEDALVRAKERLDWATSIGAKTQFPAPYTKATTAYNTAVKATILQNWQNTVSESKATIAAVAEIESLLAALQAKEAEDALARAKERLDWATGIGAKTQFPAPYTKATTAYNTAVKAKTAQNWQDTVSGSQATIAAVAEIESLLAALQVKNAEDALVRAKERLDWATSIGAKTQFPAPYTKATTAYNMAVKAKTAQNWQDTMTRAQATVAAVVEIESLLAALQVKEAEDALVRAKERLDWATGIGAKTQFPAPYTKATTAYNAAVKAKTAQNWQDTMTRAQATVAAVVEIESLLAALQVKEAEDALVRAKERLDWATGIGAKTQFPVPYTKATTAYNTAVKATILQNWQNTVNESKATVAAVAEIESLLAALQVKNAEDALVRAKERLDWATGIGAKTQFPAPYTKATTAYNMAKTAENWQDTVSGSQAAITAVAEIESLLAALQLKDGNTAAHTMAKDAEDTLVRAKERLDWATGIDAQTQFPAPYTKATTAYNTAVKAKAAQNWQDTVSGSQATISAVAEIESLLAALQAKEAEDALARAKERLDWATGIGAQTQFPAPYTKATTAYNMAKTAENWQDTVSDSQATIAAVAEIESLLAALQAKEAEDALARAKERLDWATGIGAQTQFPAPYTKATTAYNTAVKAKTAQNWQDTVSNSQAALAAVAEIESLLVALQAKEAEDALARAKEWLDWATGIGAQTQFPAPYTKAITAYNTAVKAKTTQNWQDTVSGSQAAITAVAEIESLLAALQVKDAEDALVRAKERLDWATGIGAQTQFPAPYTKATTAYNTAVKAKTAQNWQDTVRDSQAAITAIAEIESLLAALQAKEAEDALARAKERLDWATGIGAQTQFPAPYIKAIAAYSNAVKAKTAENWQDTVSGSQATIAAVAEIESLLATLQAKKEDVAAHTTVKEAEDPLVRAKERLDWATGIGAQTQFPVPDIGAKTAQNRQERVNNSQATIPTTAEIESPLIVAEGDGVAHTAAKEAENSLVREKEQLDLATGIGAQTQFPVSYTKTMIPYNTAKTVQNGQDRVSDSQAAITNLQVKEAEDPPKGGEAEPKFIPSTARLNSISLSPETRIKPIVPVNTEPLPTRSYIVKPGDSYWTIARQMYGNSDQWELLYETNKHTMSHPDNPHLLFSGMTLDIPVLSTPVPVARPNLTEVPVQIEERQPEPVTSRLVVAESLPVPKPAIPYILGTVPAVQEYTVEAGDSYWSIADRFYGDVQLWEIVYEANKNRMSNPDNPHLIFPGMVLTIPGIFGTVL